MAMYALATVPLLNKLKSTQPDVEPVRHVAFADDAIGTGKIRNLCTWWDAICEVGPHFEYYINAPKSWIIVKPHLQEEAEQVFMGTGIKITTEGKRHLGAALGNERYREEYVGNLVNDWVKQNAIYDC